MKSGSMPLNNTYHKCTNAYLCKEELHLKLTMSIWEKGHLCFKLNIILVKGLSKYILNTYFQGMKIDPNYMLIFFNNFPSYFYKKL